MGAILIGSVFLTGCTQKQEEENVIKVGLLVDLSGGLATYGNNEKHICEIAEEKINKYFEEKGIPYKVKLYVEDTKADPKVCLDKMQALHAMGINFFLGPMASGEVKNVKNFVNSNKLVIISPSSTAPPEAIGCAKPEDKKYIFRFVPTDNFQGNAIGDLAKELGLKNVIVIYRKDAWGDGLEKATVEKLKANGIKVIDEIPYDPNIGDWSPIIQTATNDISGKGNDTGIIFIGYEEVATLLAQIKDDSPLLNYKWVGCDGTANSKKVIEEVKDKAIKVGLYSTMFYSETDEAEKLKEEFKKRGYGEPDQYALNVYDAFWVGAISYAEMLNESGKYDADLLAKKIKENAIKYSEGQFGVKSVTGYIKLNEWNDRASGNYGIFAVTKDGWKLVGIWDSTTGKISWQ
ncbi:ABC-type Extracellular ligand-binding receptor [Methanocaldococcus lauensis]|uniref:ABC-type Extracellular ligand-binding receptor n=1 Tax=Methanocaldococcus lauensis TaxID=2546128 RepID=A0A8D6PRD6_9EURY|nr:ABC transporter substrate-binding protein [Methanocaldococcus lauensis]CAB3287089.1 ABC-type Extracellular ligand-binding receptor [Methanocaldococcus lauensis]